jgi:hypothetical protein
MSKARRITREEAMRTAEEFLGKPGRMLYPKKIFETPTTMFNAIIYNAGAKQIWAGDLEIVMDRETLLKLSEQVGTIYVLREGASFIKFIPDIIAVQNILKMHSESA